VNDKQQACQREERDAVREAYLPPHLKEFGSVGALTQAGSGVDSELMSMGMSSMSPMQQRL